MQLVNRIKITSFSERLQKLVTTDCSSELHSFHRLTSFTGRTSLCNYAKYGCSYTLLDKVNIALNKLPHSSTNILLPLNPIRNNFFSFLDQRPLPNSDGRSLFHQIQKEAINICVVFEDNKCQKATLKPKSTGRLTGKYLPAIQKLHETSASIRQVS